MRFRCSVSFPRSPRFVSAARHICEDAMVQYGVASPCADEIALAVSETCTNALLHARDQDEFRLDFELAEDDCRVVVRNRGGWNHQRAATGHSPMDPPTSGRGMRLINALMDDVQVRSRRRSGTCITLRKRLVMEPSIARQPRQTSGKDVLKVLGRHADMEDERAPQEVAYGS